ncbi:unnamed protein product [Rhizopus stolonifer]
MHFLFLDAFSKLSKLSDMKQIRVYAGKCKEYTLEQKHEAECKNCFERTMLNLNEAENSQGIVREVANEAREANDSS